MRTTGVKQWLSTFEVGQEVVYCGPYSWKSVRDMAHYMKKLYGCQFRCRTDRRNVRTLKRVK